MSEKGLKGLNALLKSSSIELPTVTFPERDPELEARCQKLRIAQENREYSQMTSDLGGLGLGQKKQSDEDSIAKQMKELNNYLLLIFQFIVSIGTAFASGYLAPYYFYGIEDVGKRLIFGVILAFMVAIADLYFIVRQFLYLEGVITKPKTD